MITLVKAAFFFLGRSAMGICRFTMRFWMTVLGVGWLSTIGTAVTILLVCCLLVYGTMSFWNVFSFTRAPREYVFRPSEIQATLESISKTGELVLYQTMSSYRNDPKDENDKGGFWIDEEANIKDESGNLLDEGSYFLDYVATVTILAKLDLRKVQVALNDGVIHVQLPVLTCDTRRETDYSFVWDESVPGWVPQWARGQKPVPQEGINRVKEWCENKIMTDVHSDPEFISNVRNATQRWFKTIYSFTNYDVKIEFPTQLFSSAQIGAKAMSTAPQGV